MEKPKVLLEAPSECGVPLKNKPRVQTSAVFIKSEPSFENEACVASEPRLRAEALIIKREPLVQTEALPPEQKPCVETGAQATKIQQRVVVKKEPPDEVSEAQGVGPSVAADAISHSKPFEALMVKTEPSAEALVLKSEIEAQGTESEPSTAFGSPASQNGAALKTEASMEVSWPFKRPRSSTSSDDFTTDSEFGDSSEGYRAALSSESPPTVSVNIAARALYSEPPLSGTLSLNEHKCIILYNGISIFLPTKALYVHGNHCEFTDILQMAQSKATVNFEAVMLTRRLAHQRKRKGIKYEATCAWIGNKPPLSTLMHVYNPPHCLLQWTDLTFVGRVVQFCLPSVALLIVRRNRFNITTKVCAHAVDLGESGSAKSKLITDYLDIGDYVKFRVMHDWRCSALGVCAFDIEQTRISEFRAFVNAGCIKVKPKRWSRRKKKKKTKTN